jgi:hypothetical protein
MSLADRLGQFPEPWKPQPGDQLIGLVTEVNMRSSDYGAPYPIVTLLAEGGKEYAVHAFHTMARAGVERGNLSPGTRLGSPTSDRLRLRPRPG